MGANLAEKLETARHEIINTLIHARIDPRLIEGQLQEIMSIERELYGPENFTDFQKGGKP
jgi:hypothetical protein